MTLSILEFHKNSNIALHDSDKIHKVNLRETHGCWLVFMPPLKKGAYCFATVGRSVCRSVDQVLSGQYLLTPSLDQYHTWCRGCPQWVYEPYWFSHFTCSKVKIKVKPLISDHCVVRLIFFGPFTWSIPNLVQGFPSMIRWSLLIFRSHVQRSRSNHSSQPTVLSAQYLWPLHLINTKLGVGVALNE